MKNNYSKKFHEMKLQMYMPEFFETAGSDIVNSQKMKNYSKD